jgi:hypothetical protein
MKWRVCVCVQVKQLSVTGAFKLEDLSEALKDMYKLAIVKTQPVCWILTDSQIVNDEFLIYINSILSTGWVPDLFARDEIDAILASIRNEAKASGVPDTAVRRIIDDSLYLHTRRRALTHIGSARRPTTRSWCEKRAITFTWCWRSLPSETCFESAPDGQYRYARVSVSMTFCRRLRLCLSLQVPWARELHFD